MRRAVLAHLPDTMLTKWCVRLISLLSLFAATAAAQVVVLTPTSTIFNPAGGNMVFNASVTYSTPPSVLAFSATIPAGWSHVSTATGPSVVPAAGATGTLDWIYVTAPPSPFTFNFTLAYPANVAGVQPLTSSTLTRDSAGSPGVTAPGPGVTLAVPTNSAVWGGSTTGNWTDSASWTGGVVPANSGATTFSARIATGTATNNTPVTINDLLLIGGAINNISSITIAGSGSIWEAGAFSGVGQLVIASGAFLTATTTANHDFGQTTITNQGQFIWNGSGSLRSGNGGAFVNASGATFTDATAGAVQITSSPLGGTFTFTNAGTYLKTGSTETTISVPFVNQGSLIANAGTLRFGDTFTQSLPTGNIIVASGATARFDLGLNLAAGSLAGSGTITGNVTVTGNVTNPVFISPGSILGQLTIQGNLSLNSYSRIFFDIGGTTQGTTYDFLNVTGSAALAGTITLNLVNGAQSTILPTDTFTLINASALTGTFSNAANGARLFATNGASSFLVNYTTSSLTLSGFSAVPEPSTWALLVTGLAALAGTIHRRRRQG